MSRNFNQALAGIKDTFPLPDPVRQEEFLRSLPKPSEERQKAIVPFFHTNGKPVWFALPAVVTAAVMMTVGIGVYRHQQPHSIPSIPVDTSVTDVTTTTTTVTTTITPTETPTGSSTPSEPTGIPSLFPTESPTTAAPSESGVTQPNASLPSVTPTFPTEQTRPAVSTTAPPFTLFPVQTTATTQKQDGVDADPVEPEPTETTTTAPNSDGAGGKTTYTTTKVTAATTTTATTRKLPPPTEAPTESPTNKGTEAVVSTDESDSPVCEPSESPTPVECPTECPVEDPVTETPSRNSYQIVTDVADPVSPEDVENAANLITWDDTGDVTNTDANWLDTQVDASSEIVCGYLYDITYTHVNGIPYTKLDFRVRFKMRGSKDATGSLSVYEPGGYIPLSRMRSMVPYAVERTKDMTDSEISGTYVYDRLTQLPEPIIGESYMLFLKLSTDPAIPSGAYVYAADVNYGRMIYDGKGCTAYTGKYISYTELAQSVYW